MGRTVNVFLSAFSSVLIFYLSLVVIPNLRVARLAAYLHAISPNAIIWSAMLLKDSLVLLLLLGLMMTMLQLERGRPIRGVTAILVVALLLATLRFYLPFLVALAWSTSFSLSVMQSSRKIQWRSTAAFFVSLVVLLGVVYYFREQFVESSSLFLDREDTRYAFGGGGSAFDTTVVIGSVGDALRYLPRGLTYFLLAPFPWAIQNFAQSLTLLDAIVWYPVVLVAILTMIQQFRNKAHLFLIICAAALIGPYSIFVSNIGTLYRQRLQIVPIFFIFAGLWYERRYHYKHVNIRPEHLRARRAVFNRAAEIVMERRLKV